MECSVEQQDLLLQMECSVEQQDLLLQMECSVEQQDLLLQMECSVEQQEEEIIINSINESSIRNIHEAISSFREDTKNSSISELGHEPQLLLIGEAGSGKSALAGVFINGKSGGKFGPKAGTEELVITTPVTNADGNTCYIHDTRGLGDIDVDIESMKIQVKEIFETNKCLLILCVRWDSRFVDTKTKLAFEICGSLSPDIWSKVVIAITHSDRIPPEIECLPLEQKTEEIQRLKDEWIHVILSQHPNINKDCICFTSHTEVTTIDPNWKKKFYFAILNAATCLSGALRCVYSKLSDEGFMDSFKSLICCLQCSQQFDANNEDSIQNVLESNENITDHDERGSDEKNPSNELEVPALNDFFGKVESQLYSNMLICGSIGGTVGTVSGALTGTVACGPVGGVVGALIGGGIGAVIGACLVSGISVHVVKAGMLLLWLYLKKNE